ncbi:MAG: hypothetical protein H6R01_1417 [Burkholderiaceae bacterium]|nr:hypothetical protein [Burkholderiaceae bacterium]
MTVLVTPSPHRSRTFRMLLLFVPVAVLICIGSYLLHRAEATRLHAEQARKEHETVLSGAISIGRSLQEISRDLLYLANRSGNRNLLHALKNSDLTSVANDWLEFSRSKQVYDKIRWIDETGMERLRIDYDKGGPKIAWPAELQSKANRYFFAETSKLDAGEIFVSPLDLNVEHEQIEIPYKATIRFGMPVFDENGQRRGIFLINYSADDLLERFTQVTRLGSHSDWLLNQDGYWIKGQQPEDEFGFMFGRNNLTLAHRHPDAWRQISSSENGQFLDAAGLWTYITVYPLQEWHKGNNRAASANAASNMPTGAATYSWKIVSLLPAAEYNAGIAAFETRLAGSAVVLLTLFFLGAWRMVRAQMKEEATRVELAEKEARLSSLVQTIPEMVWMKNEQGVYLACNHAFECFYGIPENAILGKTDHDFFPKQQAESFRSHDRNVITSGQPKHYEEWVSATSNGQNALLETTKVPVFTAQNQLVGILGISHDITERRKIENELHNSHHLLANLTAHVPGALFQFQLHPDGQHTLPFVSSGITSLFGVTPQQTKDNSSTLTKLIMPEDIDKMRSSVEESAHRMQPWLHEFRVNLPERGTRWLQGNAAPEKLADGSTLWHGFISDITERKQAEEGLLLAAMVYQNSSESIMVTDADNRIVAVNPAFEQMTGYLAEDVLGKNPRMLSSGQHDASFYDEMWATLKTAGRWEGEFWNRRKNGESYVVWRTINTITNTDGSVRYYVALTSDITHKKESEKLIWQQANFDALTGLSNRNMFRDQLELEIRKAKRTNLPMALVLLDLDHFKDVNDTLGHDMGDILLQEAAKRLRACVRQSDVVARLGGDEFTIILGELHEPASVERIVHDILQRLSEPFQLKEEQVHISASIGVTFYPKDATAIDELLKNADQAMYAAKHDGRNRCNFFDPSMQEVAQLRMRMISDMRGVLDGQQFLLKYQPIIDLTTGEVHKAEALIRWQHPLRGLLEPLAFIPVAEETGMIVEIGNWVFREATRQAAHWRATHNSDFQISINMSPVQFRNDNALLDDWIAHLRDIDLPGHGIAIEITENMLLDTNENTNNMLLAFRDAGIQVTADDFGTGYSSLAYLKKFDIDYIKIDQSFTQNLTPDSNDMALCKAIIVMAHTLGMKVIAEGVETPEQRDLLKTIGCDYAQGFLFSVPLPAHGFDILLQTKTPGYIRKYCH